MTEVNNLVVCGKFSAGENENNQICNFPTSGDNFNNNEALLAIVYCRKECIYIYFART